MFAAMPVGFLAQAAGAGGGGGGGGSVTISVAPIALTESGFATSWVFGNLTATVSGGTVTDYAWSVSNATGGLWQIFAGQGTATAAPSVDFIPFGSFASAEIVCTATVGGIGYSASSDVSYSSLF